ncbi:MAG: cytidylate kinase-like family protein [Propionibacteriaceae bacterium]|nr:cytidylate kinase-like family protein [Propionibacteriaceae bacterium]
MAVVTVSRQLGSHGGRIARALARELGYALVDKSVINKVIRQYGLTRLDVVYDHKPKIWELFNSDSVTTIQMMNETIAAFAARGDVVILGRGGFRVLAGLADVVNVFVKAPDSVRADRIAERDGTSPTEAGKAIKADDALRARFTKLFYSTDWADESQFDLVVDTGAETDEEACDRIAAAVRALPEPTPGVRSAATIAIDDVLSQTVADVLARRASRSA